MPNRVIRDELLQSGRWLDLPTDSHRLIYENLLLLADDYGNLEGGPRRLFRWMHSFTQIKTEVDSIKVMSDLQDADMALRYEVAGKEYWHLTRFKNSRKYWARKFPRSPYPESDRIPTKQEDIKNPDPVLTPIEPHNRKSIQENDLFELNQCSKKNPPGGVGVGELPIRAQRKPRAAPEPAKGAATWEAYSTAFNVRYGVDPVRNTGVNSMLAKFVDKLGAKEAPSVAAYYLTHDKSFYVGAKHSVAVLLRDAEGIRTDWATGQHTTQTTAMQADKRQANKGVFEKLIQEAKNEKNNT